MPTTEVYCKDCEHFERTTFNNLCRRVKPFHDMVTGEPVEDRKSCYDARGFFGGCGKKGKHFKRANIVNFDGKNPPKSE